MNASIIGQVLLNRYRVDMFVAAGGMGSVYRVWDLERSVPLAMKVLHADLMEDSGVYAKFEREARALKKLSHPNIVRFFGLFHDQDMAFLLEQYIDGPTLKQVLRKGQGRALPVMDTLVLLKALCAALGYAHNYGVVHCDVKPGNVMIDPGGTVYLTDFGIARHAESTLTTFGAAGTPAYMAPEQVRGEAVTPATDVYALGLLFYELVTGRRPFLGSENTPQGTTSAERIRYAHINLAPPDPRQFNPSLPDTVSQVILRALEKDPSARYSSTAELFSAACRSAGVSPADVPDRVPQLVETPPAAEKAGQVLPVQSSSPVERRPATRKNQGKPVLYIVAAAVFVLVLGIIFTRGINFSAPQPATEPPPATRVSSELATATAVPIPTYTLPPAPADTATAPPPPTEAPPAAPTATERPADTPTPEPSPTERPRSTTILWDVSHGPRKSTDHGLYDPSGIYSGLKSLLEQNQMPLQAYGGSLGDLDISQGSVLVIDELSAWDRGYDGGDGDSVRRFAEQGGSVLILADMPSFANHVGPVAGAFDVQTCQDPVISAPNHIADHPIMRGVGSISFAFDGGGLSVQNSAAQVVADWNGSPAVVVIDGLPGRVVIIGDTNLFDDRGLYQDDNERFALNVFHWLSFLSN